jgi:bacillithiol biosynthesis cysteine-adding enzyme BshC
MASHCSPCVIDYAAIPDPPNQLFRDYVSGAARLAPFVSGGWGLDAILSSAQSACDHERARSELAQNLAHEQESRGAAAAAARARSLSQPRSVVVVTGQQAGLFGGPALVLYKAFATILVAQTLAERLGAPVVPVFWVASDDHDFAEIRATTALDERGALRDLRYRPALEPVGQPAARIVLDESIVAVTDELAAGLSGAPFRDFVVERARAAYRPGTTLSEAFARFLSSLLPELVVLDASAGWLKTLATPLFAREIREFSPTSRLAAKVGAALVAAGYHEQVPVRPGFLNLFVYAEGQRRALAYTDGGLEIRGTDRRIGIDEALTRLAAAPGDWSAGALLRPLVQDFVLPTAAYVAGPAEIAYHAQIGSCYAHLGVPRPTLVPRPGVTLVEPREARILEAERLDLAALKGDPGAILAAWGRERHPEIEAAFARAREAVRREMAAVEQALAPLDPTLSAAADATVGRALHPIEGLHEKVVRAMKRREGERAERLRRTREALFPGGAFQERVLGLIMPLARHGPGLLEVLAEAMDPWARGHQVVSL